MKLKHNIFWNYQNKCFPSHRRFQTGIYEGFRMFAIRLENEVYLIAKDDNISGIEKYGIGWDYRRQSYVPNKTNT